MKWITLAAALAGLLGPGRAEATFVTYVETGIGTGSLGGLAFSNAPFTITSIADTANVMSVGQIFLVDNATTTVSINNAAPATFLDPSITVDDQGSLAAGILSGTTGNPGDILVAVRNPAFATYDLMSSIGPLGGDTVVGDPAPVFNTTLGNFQLTSVDATSGTFQATVAAVPEPGSFVLTGVGVLIVVGYFRRERRRSAAA